MHEFVDFLALSKSWCGKRIKCWELDLYSSLAGILESLTWVYWSSHPLIKSSYCAIFCPVEVQSENPNLPSVN